jgi:thioredoxin-dependent peroxiredoxin
MNLFSLFFAFSAFLLIASSTFMYAKKPRVGMKAPDFTLRGDDGKIHRLSDYNTRKVALYFYPQDDTPGCTKQACSIAQGYDVLQKQEITIFGINYQSPERHAQFKEKYHLPFILLSDENKQVAKTYGAYSWWHPIFPKRITILIDRGTIVEILETVDVSRHADQIMHGFNKR